MEEKEELKAVDETIKNMCGWINNNLNQGNADITDVSELAKALAKLVTARAQAITYNIDH